MTKLDPTTLSPRQLEDLGPHALHQLALRASNTLARNGVQIEDNGGSNKNISGNVLTDR